MLTISELIEELERMKSVHGDLDVYSSTFEGDSPVTGTEFIEDGITFKGKTYDYVTIINMV